MKDWDISYARYARCAEDYYTWTEIGKAATLDQAQKFKDSYIKEKTVTTIIHE